MPYDIYLITISQEEVFMISINKMSLKMTLSKLYPPVSGANELMAQPQGNQSIPHCQWSNPEEYGLLYWVNRTPLRIDNFTTRIHSKHCVHMMGHTAVSGILHINLLVPERCSRNFKSISVKLIIQKTAWEPTVTLFWGKHHRTSHMRNQH